MGARPKGNRQEGEKYQPSASAPAEPSPAKSHSLPSGVSRTSITRLGEAVPHEVGVARSGRLAAPRRGLQERLDKGADDLARVAGPGLREAPELVDERPEAGMRPVELVSGGDVGRPCVRRVPDRAQRGRPAPCLARDRRGELRLALAYEIDERRCREGPVRPATGRRPDWATPLRARMPPVRPAARASAVSSIREMGKPRHSARSPNGRRRARSRRRDPPLMQCRHRGRKCTPCARRLRARRLPREDPFP